MPLNILLSDLKEIRPIKEDLNRLIGVSDGINLKLKIYSKQDTIDFLKSFPHDDYGDYSEYHLGKNDWFKLEVIHFKEVEGFIQESICIYYNGSLCLQNPSLLAIKTLIETLKIKNV